MSCLKPPSVLASLPGLHAQLLSLVMWKLSLEAWERGYVCLYIVGKSRGSSVIPIESLAVVIMFLPTQYMLELVCGFAEIVLRIRLPPVWRLLATDKSESSLEKLLCRNMLKQLRIHGKLLAIHHPSQLSGRVVVAISCIALDCLLLHHLSQCFSSASSKLCQDRSFANLLRCEPWPRQMNIGVS